MGEWSGGDGLGDLGARGAFHVTFFIAKKVTKKSSALKNSPLVAINRLAFRFAFSLSWISRFPFLRLYGHKKGLPVSSDSFEAQVPTTRGDSIQEKLIR